MLGNRDPPAPLPICRFFAKHELNRFLYNYIYIICLSSSMYAFNSTQLPTEKERKLLGKRKKAGIEGDIDEVKGFFSNKEIEEVPV